MAGSSTAELRLRPTREDDLDYVVAAEADPDNAPFLAPSPRGEHVGFLRDPRQRAPDRRGRPAAPSASRCCGCTPRTAPSSCAGSR